MTGPVRWGVVLDSWARGGTGDTGDPELVSAAAAELVRIAVGMLGAAEPEVMVRLGGGWHQLVRTIPDAGGHPLALSVLVIGSSRAVERTRRRLGRVPVAALSAGPGMSRRPVDGTWRTSPAAGTGRPVAARRYGGPRVVPGTSTPVRPAPPTALPPAPRAR